MVKDTILEVHLQKIHKIIHQYICFYIRLYESLKMKMTDKLTNYETYELGLIMFF